MKANLLEESVTVFSEPDEKSEILATLQKGEEFEVGKVKKKDQQAWVEVTLPSGQKGYLLGDTRIFEYKYIMLPKESVNLFDVPQERAKILKTFTGNSILFTLGVENDGGQSWVHVVDETGLKGYIRGNTQVRPYQPPSRESAKKSLLYGILCICLGIAACFSSFFLPLELTAMVVGIIFIGLGLWSVILGLIEYKKASEKAQKTKAQ